MDLDMADKKMHGDKEYFILLENTDGIKRKKVIGGPTICAHYNALKGELFENDTSKSNEFTFVSTEYPDRTITCVEEKLRLLKNQEYYFLIAVVSKNERMRLIDSTNILKEIMNIKKGDLVSVELYINSGTRSGVIGKVHYIGSVTGKIGHYFGIHLEVGNFKIKILYQRT